MGGHTVGATIAYVIALVAAIGAVVAFFGLGHTPAGWLTLAIIAVIAAVIGSVLDRRPGGRFYRV